MPHFPDDAAPLAPSSTATPTAPPAARLRAEVLIVLGLSLGSSAVYSIVRLITRLTAPTPLGQQGTTLNASASPRPYLDLTYQVLGIAFALVPVLLALYLLSAHGARATKLLGFNFNSPGRDVLAGVGLAAVIGIPGLAFYALGRVLGITVQINASGLDPYWWALPVLLLSAARHAVVEEVIVVGYLSVRLEQLGWRPWQVVAASSVLRGTYHLYQGIGPFFGNVVMGVVFAEYFRRKRRTMPLVLAHFILDLVAFFGYQLLPASWLAALGLG